jgi:hypothetical protein
LLIVSGPFMLWLQMLRFYFICDRVFFVAFLVCCIHSDHVIFLLFFTFL